jgi:hypothetical protein
MSILTRAVWISFSRISLLLFKDELCRDEVVISVPPLIIHAANDAILLRKSRSVVVFDLRILGTTSSQKFADFVFDLWGGLTTAASW